jgi:hypothetical protein
MCQITILRYFDFVNELTELWTYSFIYYKNHVIFLGKKEVWLIGFHQKNESIL